MGDNSLAKAGGFLLVQTNKLGLAVTKYTVFTLHVWIPQLFLSVQFTQTKTWNFLHCMKLANASVLK